ncbi:MAG: hypothetical protein QW350_05585 [Candidatus Aenigmatarchaeota archaeon]|jgi:hypothetical protein
MIGIYQKIYGNKGILRIKSAKRHFESDVKSERKDGKFLYVRKIKIAGPEKIVVEYLKKLGKNDKEIDEIIKDSYHYKNYNVPESEGGLKESFEKEIEESNGAYLKVSLSEINNFLDKVRRRVK